jgi:hypothetical protein
MLSASPPDQPLRMYPRLTRLRLVQPWAVLQIPFGDYVESAMAEEQALGRL